MGEAKLSLDSVLCSGIGAENSDGLEADLRGNINSSDNSSSVICFSVLIT